MIQREETIQWLNSKNSINYEQISTKDEQIIQKILKVSKPFPISLRQGLPRMLGEDKFRTGGFVWVTSVE